MSSTNACLKCGKPFTHTLESIQHYCMSDADKGPREFELYFFYGDVKVISKNEVFILHEEKIHVVEHSAYDDLANMYAVLLNAHTKLQKELDAMLINRNHYCNVYQKTQKQLAKAQEEIKEYRDALGMIDAVGVPEPYDKIAKEALNKWERK